jgi:hypothetical protein
MRRLEKDGLLRTGAWGWKAIQLEAARAAERTIFRTIMFVVA